MWFRLLAALAPLVGARGTAAVAWSRIGERRVAARDFAGAVASFRRACELDRDPQMKALDLGNLAYCQYRSGQLDDAARSYQAGLSTRFRARFYDGIESDLKRYYHVCHYLGHASEASEAYGMLLTPRGSPVAVKVEQYPLELDERGGPLPVVRMT